MVRLTIAITMTVVAVTVTVLGATMTGIAVTLVANFWYSILGHSFNTCTIFILSVLVYVIKFDLVTLHDLI